MKRRRHSPWAGQPVYSLEMLDDAPDHTRVLSLRVASGESLRPLERFGRLRTLQLRGEPAMELDVLSKLPLEHLEMRVAGSTAEGRIALPELGRLRLLSLSGAFVSVPALREPSMMTQMRLGPIDLASLEGFASYPALEQLVLGPGRLKSLDGLDKLERLRILVLHAMKIENVDGVDQHPSLRLIATAGSTLPSFPESMRWCVSDAHWAAHTLEEMAARHEPPANTAEKAPYSEELALLLSAEDRSSVTQGIELQTALNENWNALLHDVVYAPHSPRTILSPFEGPHRYHAALALLARSPRSLRLKEFVGVLRFEFARAEDAVLEPWTFGAFPNLRDIELSYATLAPGDVPELPDLDRVQLRGVIGNLRWLERAPRIKELSLVGRRGFVHQPDLDGLAHLPVERLAFEELRVPSRRLGSLEHLEELTLGPRSHLDPDALFDELPQLRHVVVAQSNPLEVVWIDRAPELRTIRLDLRKVTDFEPFYRHPKLEAIDGTAGYGQIDRKRLGERGIRLT